MKNAKILTRGAYICVIAALIYWIVGGLGSQKKDYSDLESSMSSILAGRQVDLDKRVQVVEFLNRRLDGHNQTAYNFDPKPVLKKILDGQALTGTETLKLQDWIDHSTSLNISHPPSSK